MRRILALALILGGQAPVQAAQTVTPTPVATVQPLPPVANADPWFGSVNAIFAPQRALEAGAHWQRLIFPWDQIQPNGPADFAQGYFSDAEIDAQLALGLEVVGITIYTPTWAARDPQYGARSAPRGLELPIDDPRNTWATYVKQLVSHYRGKINTWVFYNEPDMYADSNDFRTFAGTPRDFALIYRTGYLAAKSVDPNVKIVMAGFTYWWDKEASRPQYFQRILDEMARDPDAARSNWYFDALDVHVYGNPLNSFAQPLVYRQIMQARGIDKPIWIIESNVLINDDAAVGAGPGPFRASMEEQASYMIESMALARAAGVQRYSVYRTADEIPEGEDEFFGLVRADGTVRPSYVAYQVAATYFRNVRGATYSWSGSSVPPTAGEISALLASNANRVQWPWPGAVNTVVLDRGAQRVTVVWNASPNPAQTVIPALGSSALLVDKHGNARSIAPEAGAYQLDLEPSRNNSDPRDPSLYLVGGSPWILLEDVPPVLTPTLPAS